VVKGINLKMIIKTEIILVAVVVIALLYGCGSDTKENAPVDTTDPSFASQIQPIFDGHCIRCHKPERIAEFLDLSSGASYSALVGISSVLTAGGDLLVSAGDSANSVLYMRISGTGLDNSEDIMPQGTAALSSANLALIASWIDSGAKNN
jgi:mono/diheme cytochrome c family protein